MNQVAVKENKVVSMESAKQSDRLMAFKGYIIDNKDSISSLLPKSVPFETFQEVCLSAVENRPELLDCGRSLFSASKKLAKMGLYPDGNEAHIEVRNTKIKDENNKDKWVKLAVAMPMGYGLNKLALEAGYSVTTGVVYEKDEFDFDPINDNKPRIKIDWFKPRGNAALFYAIFDPNDGTKPIVELINSEEMQKIRDCAPTDYIWQKWTDEKSRNAVLKRGAKRIKKPTPHLQYAIEVDNEGYDFEKLASPKSQLPLPKTLETNWSTINEDELENKDLDPDGDLLDLKTAVDGAVFFDDIADIINGLIESDYWQNSTVNYHEFILRSIIAPKVKELSPKLDLGKLDIAGFLAMLWVIDDETLNNYLKGEFTEGHKDLRNELKPLIELRQKELANG